nr:MAG TPA: hypothetical protein [Caudoviricetes sp.]
MVFGRVNLGLRLQVPRRLSECNDYPQGVGPSGSKCRNL